MYYVDIDWSFKNKEGCILVLEIGFQPFPINWYIINELALQCLLEIFFIFYPLLVDYFQFSLYTNSKCKP